MNDIQNRVDIEFVVNEFYKRVVIDPLIGHFFTQVKQLSFEHHIPVIVSFWDSILFDSMTYKGNPMLKHLELSKLSELEQLDFERWISIWTETIRSNFNGPVVDKAIEQANTMGRLMLYKIQSQG